MAKSSSPIYPEIKPEQSIELLKALHILTRDGRMNQDSRRKLKQVYHLYQFIAPLLSKLLSDKKDGQSLWVVDHGAGKSYLGFILYDLFFKQLDNPINGVNGVNSVICGIETRADLIEKSKNLANALGFERMLFEQASINEAAQSSTIPAEVDMVTALHACNTATDDAIAFGLAKKTQCFVLVPCCQAEVASHINAHKKKLLAQHPIAELIRHPIHTRELGSHLTNVLRVLQLEASGYAVTVTELVGWEHSLKNELIIAKKREQPNLPQTKACAAKQQHLLSLFGLEALASRFAPL